MSVGRGRQVLLAALALSCVKGPPGDLRTSDEVRFADRTIALSPYLEGYPYRSPLPVFEAGVLVYEHLGATTGLRTVPLDGSTPDLEAGAPLGAVDWSTRSRWDMRYHAPSGALYFLADERNDERMNLYRLPLRAEAAGAEAEPVALTDEPYLYGWAFDDADERLAIVVRRPADEPGAFTSCLELAAPDGGERAQVICDTPDASFTWTNPSWAPDGRGVVIGVNLDGHRSRRNLAWVPFDRPEVQLLLDVAATRSQAWALSAWLDRERFVVVDDSTGLPRIGVYDLAAGEARWLVALDRDLADLRVLRPGDAPVLMGVLHRADGDAVVTWDPETGEELGRLAVDGTVDVRGDDEGGRALISWTSAATPFQTAWVDVGPDGAPTLAPWLGLPDALAGRIVQCDVERVTFPTHDLDPATGEPRQLHGILYTPREPLDPPAARITAFYGGANRFDTETQILCEAGVATLSPAVRGSWGYGPTFHRLNDGDLGGDEIADLFHAARWLVDAEGYPEDRVGVYGRSHGGYATMRALTFPPGTNGHDAVFPFAFGLADAGFSDIVSFHDTSNIPDWVLLEAGDPAGDADRLRDRSPLHHVDLLQAPLLLVHGENDSRVPVQESRQMAAACEAAGKPCTYVEVPGQGHRVRGLDNERQVWQARLGFLEDVLFD